MSSHQQAYQITGRGRTEDGQDVHKVSRPSFMYHHFGRTTMPEHVPEMSKIHVATSCLPQSFATLSSAKMLKRLRSKSWVMLSEDGFTPLPGESTLYKSPNRTTLSLQSLNKFPGKEPFSIYSGAGNVYLTNRRVSLASPPIPQDAPR